MLLGIDVGGTHTDAVLLDTACEEKKLVALCKVATNPENLLESINAALKHVLAGVDPRCVTQLNLSTTLSTNAIVQGRTEDVAVLVSPGPGIDPQLFRPSSEFHVLGGSIDHRGNEVQPLPVEALRESITSCKKRGVRVFAAVGKFSLRNPAHERLMREQILQHGDADFISMGHELGGVLSFPRRLATAYFNGAVWRLYGAFASAVSSTLEELGLEHVRVHILKADGGTIPLATSCAMPVQSIFSGPAASVMGALALCHTTEDSIVLDIGGTTTDIALLADGVPLVERDGISIGSYPTLVRALKVQSIGVGGDSALGVDDGCVRVGPHRLGPSLAMGGHHPTLTDALNYLGLCSVGDEAASDKGIHTLATENNMESAQLATLAAQEAANAIYGAASELLQDVHSRPVYTLHELLEGKDIAPSLVYVVGGPAQAMQSLLGQAFSLPIEIPPNHGVANAVGAALTRVTWELELFADTQQGVLFVPCLSHEESIDSSYSLDQGRDDAVQHLVAYLGSLGVAVEPSMVQVTEASSFSMINDYGHAGRTLRVQCQICPGVVQQLGAGGPCNA